MRILLVIAAILVAFVAGILFATSGSDVERAVETRSSRASDSDRAAEPLAEVRRVTPTQEFATSEPIPDREVREVIERNAPSTIAGRVHHADGTPAARAMVGLFAPAVENDGPDSAYSAATAMDPRRLDPFRVVRVWTRSDDEGLFAFQDVLPGTWIVRAEDGPLLAAATLPLVMQEGGTHSGLVIQLPPAARLEGRARFPVGTRLDDLCLELRSKSPLSVAPWMHTLRDPAGSVRERMDEDGSFRLGPVEPGSYTVGLVVDTALAKGGRIDPFAGAVAPLVDIQLGPGTTVRDIDLTSGIPGVIELHLDFGGFVPSSGPVSSRRGAPARVRARLRPLFDLAGRGPGMIDLKVDEPNDVGPLVPGTWQISLDFPVDSMWSWPLDPPVHVRAGERVRYDARVNIRRAEIEFVDQKSGLPFEGFVLIGREMEIGFMSSGHVTGKDGKLSLILPPGRYLATGREQESQDWILDPSQYARFEWSESGPSVTSLRVPR